MKIGIDAKWFYTGNPSGRVVVRNLIKHLIEMETEHDLYLFLNRREKGNFFPYTNPRVHLIYVWGGNNQLSNLFVLPILALHLKLDVVVYQYFSPLWSHAKKIAFIHDIIFVTHPQFFTFTERVYLNSMRILGRLAHRICTVSENERKRIEQCGLSSFENIDVVHNGVDEVYRRLILHDVNRIEEVKSKYDLPGEFLLYVGRLNERKNIRNLLRAIPLLKNKNIPLVIVGNYDWKMFDLEEEINRLDIAGRVIRAGFVVDEDLPVLFALAKIFCFISFEEGFGLPALEAMASGVPVVVANTSSLPEVCGEAGNYTDPHDPDSIAAVIGQLLDDCELFEVKRMLGLERAALFTWKKSAEALMRSIQKTVDL